MCCGTIPAKLEQQPAEGAFLACTLWLADAYVLAGEHGKAQELFDRVVAVANDLGLLAEEYDTAARRQTGNFPQALTHIALINTAHNLVRSEAVGQEAGDAAVEVAAGQIARAGVPHRRGRSGLGEPAFMGGAAVRHRLALADLAATDRNVFAAKRLPEFLEFLLHKCLIWRR